MKRFRTVGLCLLAVFAFGAYATSALAAPPDFGNCKKKAVAGGAGFSDAGCTKAVGSAGKYEWLGFAGISNKEFKAHMSTGLATLEGVPAADGGTGAKIICKTEKNGGALYTGEKTVGNIVAEFGGCETSGTPCNSAGNTSGNITTKPLEGSLGIEKLGATAAANKLENQLKGPAGGPLAEFECSALAKIVTSGCVAHPVTSNKMLKTATEKFTATKGEQKPDKFAGGPENECALSSALNGGTPEEAGQTITALLENAAPEGVEANSVA
ncbi:MAG: hypothetical protein M3Z95_06875 [Actinomycetota bacterium]|nr:hypothetical protein [Actinomycetota bacterium]